MATPAVLQGWTILDIRSIGTWVSQANPGETAGLRLIYLHLTYYRYLVRADRRSTKKTERKRGLFADSGVGFVA